MNIHDFISYTRVKLVNLFMIENVIESNNINSYDGLLIQSNFAIISFEGIEIF